MASAIDPFDPMEKAFHALGAEQEGDRVSQLRGDGHQIRRLYPLEKPVLAMAQAWGAPDVPGGLTIATKGAPETIADLCGASDAQRAEIREMVEQMAADGLRVLSALLAYPDSRMRGYLPEMSELLRDEGALSPARRAEVDALIDTLRQADPLQAEADYVDLFDRGISQGDTPRLWIDSVAHISMGRDKRIYRFTQDTRFGRIVTGSAWCSCRMATAAPMWCRSPKITPTRRT